jgi:hypothetical protein
VQAWQHAQPSDTNRPRGLISPADFCRTTGTYPPAQCSCLETRTIPISQILFTPEVTCRRGRTRGGSTLAGDYSARATPVPIPNTVVKPRSADGTAGEIRWESTTSPACSSEAPIDCTRSRSGLLHCRAFTLANGIDTQSRRDAMDAVGLEFDLHGAAFNGEFHAARTER